MFQRNHILLSHILFVLLLLSFVAGISSCGSYFSVHSTVHFDTTLVTRMVKLDCQIEDEHRTLSSMVRISEDTVALLRRIAKRTMRIQAFNSDLDSLWATDIPVDKDEKYFNLYCAHGTVFVFSQIENVDDSIDVVGRAFSGSTGKILRDSAVLLRAGEDLRHEWQTQDTSDFELSLLFYVEGSYHVLFSPDSSHVLIATVGELQSTKEKGFFYHYNIKVVNYRMEEIQKRFIDLSAIVLDDQKIPPYVGVDNDGILYVQNLIQNKDSLHLTITQIPPRGNAPYPHIQKSFPVDSLGYKPSIAAISNLILSKGKGITVLLFNQELKERKSQEPLNGVAMLDWDFTDSHISMGVTSFKDRLIQSSIANISTEDAFLSSFTYHPNLGTSLLVDLHDGNKRFMLLLFYDPNQKLQWVQSYPYKKNEWYKVYSEPGESQIMIHEGLTLLRYFFQTTDMTSGVTTRPKEIARKGQYASLRGLVKSSSKNYFFLIDRGSNSDFTRLFNVQIP